MKRSWVTAVLPAALALMLAGVAVPSAEAAARASTKVRITGWEVLTTDTGLDGTVVPAGGSFTEHCDTVLEVDVNLKGTHVRKGAAYTFTSTYAGVRQYSYTVTWPRSGTVAVQQRVMKTANTAGTLTVTVKAKGKRLAQSSLPIRSAGCQQ